MSEKVKYVEDKLDYDADIYGLYRKDTPDEIISKIMLFLRKKYESPMDIAIDVGCGSGQSTVVLAPIFKKVFGIDGIESQIEEAKNSRTGNNIVYKCGPAETLPFENSSVQLITTATSLHWFDMDRFFPEARRILSNNGVLAVYGYTSIKPALSTSTLNQKIDKLYEWFYEVLDPYTKPQVKILIHKYKNVEFPFEEVVRVPDVRCMIKGRLADIIGYVKTFSILKICREQDPAKETEILAEFEKRLYEIGAADNIAPNQVTNLYIDYVLVLCRKSVS